MKACIISAVDLSRMTMVSAYTEYMESHGIEYDIIYVDKYKDKSPFNANALIPYNVDKYKNSILPVKFIHFWRMRGFLSKKLDEGQYDFGIVWGELAAFLFADILDKKLHKRYCVNIRDYFYNDVFFVKSRLSRAISGTAFCTVSSEAYLKFLPENADYVFMHSLNKKIISSLEPKKSLREKGKKIRILYIGLIARLPYAYKLIDALGNDERFELQFVGIGAENIDKYIEGKGYTNIITHGAFAQSETAEFLADSDIIYNLYGYGNRHFDLALSIKLYYAIYLHMPIMVFDGTQTAKTAEECGIAFVMHGEEYEGIGDRLYDYYQSLDFEKMTNKCCDFMKQVDESHLQLHRHLDDIFRK